MYEATILDKTGKKFSPLLPPFQWWKKCCTLPLPPDLMGWNKHPKVGHNILSACSYTVFHQLLKMLGDRKAQWRHSSPVKEGTLFFYIHNSPVYSFITIGFDQAELILLSFKHWLFKSKLLCYLQNVFGKSWNTGLILTFTGDSNLWFFLLW